jgi:hypothetical protein
VTELQADRNLREEIEQLLSRHTVENPIIVSRQTIRIALQRFLENEYDVGELVEWANLIEAYDQVQYESGFEQLIADVLFSIASPEINEPLTADSCRRLIGRLAG